MQQNNLKAIFANNSPKELFEVNEDVENSLEFKRNIDLSKDNMDRFFIENSYLKNTIKFEESNQQKKNDDQNKLDTNDKILSLLTDEVNHVFNSNYQNPEKNLKTILDRMEKFSSEIANVEREENHLIEQIKNSKDLCEEENLREIQEYEKSKKQNNVEYYSFKKKTHFESKKKKMKKEILKSKEVDNKGVFSRLMNKKDANNVKNTFNEYEFKDLDIVYDSNKKLFNDLKKAKSKNEQLKIVKENWENFEKNFSDSISNLRNHDFTLRFKQKDFNLNVFLANFMHQKDKLLNIKKDNQNENEDEEDLKIKQVVDNFLNSDLLELWKDYKYDNLFFN
jgi:hypothetical protein